MVKGEGEVVFMRCKAPRINGKLPDRHFDLDNEADLLQLGLDPHADLKIADKYVHYPNCKYAVIECSSTFHKAIDQVESTAKRLLAVGRAVNILAIVVDRLNSWEQKMFKRRPRDSILRNRKTGKPRLVRAGNKTWLILLFYRKELDRVSKGLDIYFREDLNWGSM